MHNHNLPSDLLNKAVKEFSRLPGVGSKTALRYVLQVLKWEQADIESFSDSIKRLYEDVRYCEKCNNISDSAVCSICSNASRDSAMVCVVESIKDVMAIENTGQYNGQYHVLGGIISPMDGIGPDDLSVDKLIQRVDNKDIREIILALSTTMEGDTTNFYIYRKLQKFDIKITTLARGVAIGDELEYADSLTLGRSIVNRNLFDAGM